jgi:hypothetical protein
MPKKQSPSAARALIEHKKRMEKIKDEFKVVAEKYGMDTFLAVWSTEERGEIIVGSISYGDPFDLGMTVFTSSRLWPEEAKDIFMQNVSLESLPSSKTIH